MKSALTLLLALLLFAAPALAAQPTVTRLEFITALWAHSGAVPYDATTPFSDLPQSTALAWAYDLGITTGTGGDLFSPSRAVTREEAALLLRRYGGVLGQDIFLPEGMAACNDYHDISPWGDDSLYWATNRGLISWAPGGRLFPKGTLTQQQLTQILSRFFDVPVPILCPLNK